MDTARRPGAWHSDAGRCELAADTCREQLSRLHAQLGTPPDPGIDWTVPWREAEDDRPAAEATVQAECGLMHVHGLRWGRPRRLGLDVASVAAGLLAAQGAIAAMIGRSRGLDVRAVRVPVTAGGLAFLRHHLAIATCGDPWRPPSPPAWPGTPLACADGARVELEALTFESWARFWRLLGVDGPLEESWSGLVFRFLTARCGLPPELHRAAARRSLAEVRAAAAQAGVAACEVRSYARVVAEDPDADPWTLTRAEPPGAPADAPPAPPVAPLAGLRVVEITTRLQGPLAGLLLGLLGADVTKIEPPGGDFGKRNPPRAGPWGAAHLAYNRGKTSVELDYKGSAGRAELLDRLREADVFLHNWRPGRAERLGLDAASLGRLNRRLVCAEAGGWGAGAAPSDFATDCLVQAHAGCGDGLNPAGTPPVPSLVPLTDVTGALLACLATLAGLYLREREGAGCQAQTSLLAAAAVLQARALDDVRRGGRDGRPAPGPLFDPVETADGLLAVDADRDAAVDWRRRPAHEWEAELLDAGVPAAVVSEDLAHLAERLPGAIEEVDGGACRLPAAPWLFQW